MSYLPLDQLGYKDSLQLDATGRLRVANVVTIIGQTQEYNFHPLLWDHFTVSGGTVTYTQQRNSTILSTAGATSGARAIRQTKVYHRWAPGSSHTVKNTGRLQAGAVPTGGAVARIGYFDDNNGLFFYQDATGLGVAVRSDVSGAPVDTLIPRSTWNIDKMDGTGPSGYTFDPTKQELFIIDLQGLGVGRVRFGLQINGINYVVHETYTANISADIYMRTARLPPRFEVFNTSAGSNISLEAGATAIESENGTNGDGIFYPFSYSAYVNAPMSLDTTLRPIIARRLRNTFNGKTARGQADLIGLDLRVATNDVYFEILYNTTVTIGGGGSVVTSDVDTNNSQSEFDVYTGAANTVTGGTRIFAGFAVSGQGSAPAISQAIGSSPGGQALGIVLGRTYANIRDQYTLAARAITGTATISVISRIREQY